MNTFLEQLRLKPLPTEGPLDSGAEEELFRRVGQQAVATALAERWQQADPTETRSCPDCQGEMKKLGRRAKSLQTLCGPMTLQRQVFHCPPCGTIQAPLDQRLGVDQTGISPALNRLLCRTALELPYQQSQRLLSDTLGFCPASPREIERVAKRHGEWLEKQQWAEPAEVRRRVGQPSRKPVYCLGIDAVLIAGLPDAVEHCLNWHDVKIAVAFDPRQVQSPFYVAGREEVERFGERLWNQCQRRQLEAERFFLILGDGAPWIWNLAETYFHGVPQLLDFYHAAQHLYATAEALWPPATALSWWHRRLEQLKAGQQENFFAALKLSARRHDTADAAVSPKRLLQYFQDNRTRLDYPWAIAHHLPIGSGSVESAGRHIVQQRLKLSGMRWSDAGAQSILNLRTLHRSGDFEQYWENYAATGS